MLTPVWDLLETHVFPAPSTNDQFNPYSDRNEELDVPDAPLIRRENVREYLETYEAVPPLFLLLEAPGPWGCRFSGVPITSEAQLLDPDFPLQGRRTSRNGDPHTEYSASIFWRVLRPYFPHFFVWNSVPMHPHPPSEPLSIRTPRRTEVREWQTLLKTLLTTLTPDCIIGVGRKAERALNEVDADPIYVRHPSQGGAKKFESGMRDVVQTLNVKPARPSGRRQP